MPFEPGPRAQALLDAIPSLLRDLAYPLEDKLLRGEASFAELVPALDAARSQVRDAGFWSPQLPTAWGGMGLSVMDFAHVSEALGRCVVGHYLFNCQAPDAGNMELLIEFGTPEQQERWLRPLVEGKIRSCFTMTEPQNAGSNPVYLDSTAEVDGAEWVLNGHKWYSTAADGATIAVAMMVTDPGEAHRHQRASMIVVPTETPGFEIVRNLPVMGERGSGWMSHSEVKYTACRVPLDHLLGPRGGGFRLAQARLGPGRIHHCMRWIGICERALDLLCQHAASRELSPGVPLGSKQIVQAWIAESRAEINAARLMVLDAAYRIDKVGTKNARVEISTIKFFVAGVMGRVLDRALQAHGGLGMVDDLPLAWLWRHERAARIYDGADEVHKSVVARHVLRGYGVRIG